MINKRSILIFLVLLILFNIHSQDNKIHIPELVKTFPWGKVGGAFGRWTGETPTAFTFDNTGKMYALDVRNKRISVFDSNFEFIRNILPSTTVYYKNRIYIDDNNDIITVNYAQDGAISKIDQNGKKKFHLNFNLLKIHGLQIKKNYSKIQ